MDPQFVELSNFRIGIQNAKASSDYDKIVKTVNDIDRNAIAIKNAQLQLNKINKKLDYPDGEIGRAHV